jgi:hypothetical protein
MNQKEASSIIDSMIERTRLGAQDLGPGAIELYKLYKLMKALRMNIHEMKKEVYTIISEEGEIKEKVFFEIYQKHIKESQRDRVKDLIREAILNQIGI